MVPALKAITVVAVPSSGASVAPETRARIEAAARQLGYSPNAMAQGLITRR